MEVFETKMSVALFTKNNQPVGTRYLTLKEHEKFFPTIALCANRGDVVVDVVWQNRILNPPLFNVVRRLLSLGDTLFTVQPDVNLGSREQVGWDVKFFHNSHQKEEKTRRPTSGER